MKPVAPLWGFFNFIKDKSAIPLSIDQYFYMLKALHEIDGQTINTNKELLAFTKLFWLNDISFTERYDYHFNHFISWDHWLTPPDIKPQKDVPNVTTPDPKPVDIEPPDTLDTGDDPLAGDDKAATQKTEKKPNIVDFELVLQDSNQARTPEKETASPRIKHSFNLSDSAIMPFDMRNFIQRLRRKVETTEQVQSDEIDVPIMIEHFVDKGFIDEIIYKLEDSSHSNVVLLCDRFGSMLAYEYLEKYMRLGLRQIPHCDYQDYFFYNLPQESEDSHYLLKACAKRQQALHTGHANWNRNTWFFVLSDAGAHSGMVNKNRIRHTLKLWHYLKNISNHTHWINPVPFHYLNDCTARRLQMAIPMVNPDQKSLNQMLQNESTY